MFFLPHAECSEKNFFKLQQVTIQLNTLQKKSIFWFSPQLTFPDGIAQRKKLGHEFFKLGHLKAFTHSGSGL
jgi:hypothetical protein